MFSGPLKHSAVNQGAGVDCGLKFDDDFVYTWIVKCSFDVLSEQDTRSGPLRDNSSFGRGSGNSGCC